MIEVSDDAKTLADVISRLPAYTANQLGGFTLYHLDDVKAEKVSSDIKVLLINEKHRKMIVNTLMAANKDTPQ